MPRLAIIGSCLLAIFAVTGTGCASIVNGKTETLTVVSHPPGARVSVPGTAISGLTPMKITLPRGKVHNVVFEKAGYQPKSVPIKQKTSGWVAGNIAFGFFFWVGLIVDYSKGSAYSLSPENIEVDLKRDLSQNRVDFSVERQANESPLVCRKRCGLSVRTCSSKCRTMRKGDVLTREQLAVCIERCEFLGAQCGSKCEPAPHVASRR